MTPAGAMGTGAIGEGAASAARGGRPPAVAILHYTAPPVVGGVEHVIGRHASLMADAGHEVRLIAGSGNSQDPRVRFSCIPLMAASHPVVGQLQLDLDAGRMPDEFEETTLTLRAALDDALAGVDVVIAHNLCSLNLNLALTVALRDLHDRGRVPHLIAWHHDLAWSSPAYRPKLHEGHPWSLLREAWPGAVQVVVSGERRREYAALTGLSPESIAVVPNGLDAAQLLHLEARTAEVLAWADTAGLEPLLLVPARITPRKNIELALHVVAAIRAAGRPAGLIVTGPVDPHRPAERDLLARLLALRATLCIENAVRFLATEPDGPPSDAVVSDLYRIADALFFPSRDEGFGLPLLESAVHRLPIICANLPVLRELAGEAATYFAVDDAPAVVAACVLQRLSGDPLVRLARRVRRVYSWEAVWRRIAPLLPR